MRVAIPLEVQLHLVSITHRASSLFQCCEMVGEFCELVLPAGPGLSVLCNIFPPFSDQMLEDGRDAPLAVAKRIRTATAP